MTEDPIETNRAMWDELAEIHPETAFYDVDGFLAGDSTLRRPERNLLPDVAGRSLVHLQCHIGLDTLSWAREGADVTGVDFSTEAVAAAREIAAETDTDAEFVCCSVTDVPDVLDTQFDIVFASYGVLTWIPNVREWARAAAALLRSGGRFCLVENHPVMDIYDWEFEPRGSYFETEPARYDESGTYADPDAETDHTVSYQWTHGLGEVLTALADAGLSIETVSEYPYTYFERFNGMERDDEGCYRVGPDCPEIPLLYAVSATG
jgi:SAM-dependent methyltransferase